mgnify:CR=1 FL=1
MHESVRNSTVEWGKTIEGEASLGQTQNDEIKWIQGKNSKKIILKLALLKTQNSLYSSIFKKMT